MNPRPKKALGRPPARGRWKRWYLAALAAPVVLAALLAALRAGPSPAKADNDILKDLAAYGARYELDENSRVTRLVLEGKQVNDSVLEAVGNLKLLRRLSLHNSA